MMTVLTFLSVPNCQTHHNAMSALALSGLITLEGKKFFLEKLFTLFTWYFYYLFS